MSKGLYANPSAKIAERMASQWEIKKRNEAGNGERNGTNIERVEKTNGDVGINDIIAETSGALNIIPENADVANAVAAEIQ